MDFTGKNVVFIGGLGGIGYETCKQLIKKTIAILYVLDIIENAKALFDLQALNSKVKVRFIKFDLTDKNSIKNGIKTIVDECKYIDILVNGSGFLSEVNYERMISINLTGLITTTFEALPFMDKQRYGRGGLVANISSVYGLEPCAALVSYSATKFGVIGFTRSMANPFYYDLTGVAFTIICPGYTETALKRTGLTDYTFDYSKPIIDKLSNIRCQTSQKCAEHFIKVIEANKNGSIWISDGDLKEIELKVYWTPILG